MVSAISGQMIIMAVYMAIGFVLYKTGAVTKEGSKTLTNLLIYFITPVSIFRSYCIAFSAEKLKTFGICFLLGLGIQLLSCLVCHFIFNKDPLAEFAASYANAGFFGIPLIEACLGLEAVFYIAPLVVFVGAFQHSYGVKLLLGKDSKLKIKRIIFSPNSIALMLGMLVFVLNLGDKFPPIVGKITSSVAGMSAFFAMSILGVFLAQSKLCQFKNLKLYFVGIVRLLIVPVLMTVIFKFIPVDYGIKLAILIAFAGPVGSNVANYSLLYDKDYVTACLYVTIGSVFCMFTLPLFTALAEKIL